MTRTLSFVSRILPLITGCIGLMAFHVAVSNSAIAAESPASKPPAKGTPAAMNPGPAAPAATAPPSDPSAGAARTFKLDAKKSRFVLQVFKDGAASALAHDHTVHATAFDGEVIADPLSPTSARVSITVQAASLVNDDPVMRQRFKLDPIIPEKDKEAVYETMLSDEQLDVQKFPTIGFVSSGVEKDGEKLVLVGDFTLKGVTRKVRMPITAKVDGTTLTGDASLKFKQSDWGMKPYSAFLGAVRNKDEVILHVHLVAHAAL